MKITKTECANLIVSILLKDNKLIFCEANSHAAFDFFLEKEIRIDDEILSYIKKFF